MHFPFLACRRRCSTCGQQPYMTDIRHFLAGFFAEKECKQNQWAIKRRYFHIFSSIRCSIMWQQLNACVKLLFRFESTVVVSCFLSGVTFTVREGFSFLSGLNQQRLTKFNKVRYLVLYASFKCIDNVTASGPL